jgi:cytidylate kinase
MKANQIITIGREFGSGGHEVGVNLSKKLGIPFYDKEILAEASKKSGYSQAIFEKHDEKPTSSFLYALAMGVNSFGNTFQRPLVLDLYLAQFETIRKLAEDGPGIFIGRCSDYVLNDMENVLNVFIHSDVKSRVERIMSKYQVSEKDAYDMIKRKDKDRASYYNYYSNEEWGDSRHYDMCLNTGKLGIEKVTDIIYDFVK